MMDLNGDGFDLRSVMCIIPVRKLTVGKTALPYLTKEHIIKVQLIRMVEIIRQQPTINKRIDKQ